MSTAIKAAPKAKRKATIPAAISFAAGLPILGAELADGKFQGVTTLPDGQHVVVVFLGIAEKKASHKAQVAWAKKLGGQLVTRAVINLLIATMTLPAGWYWTADEYGSGCAWDCSSDGYQLNDYRSAEGGAVAVRLIPLVA